MTGAHSYDAVVVGAGVNGLAAASYLAMAGKRVLVLEARDKLGGLSETGVLGEGFLASKAAHALYALDPTVIKELKLSRHGLRYAARDLPLVGLRPGGKHVVITRDGIATARHLASHSDADGRAWLGYKREWLSLARAMRAVWWRAGSKEIAAEIARVARVARMGTSGWLDSWFESDALKATLGFDAHALSPLSAGSALVLLWRAAQEMCGLQGATALPRGGLRTLADAFAGAARATGAETRTGAHVADILVDRDRAAVGVALASGETIAAPLVLSSLSRRTTLGYPTVRASLGFAAQDVLERSTAGGRMARVILALDAEPAISGVPSAARFVIAERLDSLAAAHAAARAGRLPEELTMEVIVPTAAEPALAPKGKHLVSVLVGPVPADVTGGWRAAKPVLAARVVATLARHMTGLSRHLVGLEVLSPADLEDDYGADDAFGGPVDAARLLAPWRARVRTDIKGLILCGAAADPVGAVSGRGGRMGACYAFEQEKTP